jgi:hypothetical protein
VQKQQETVKQHLSNLQEESHTRVSRRTLLSPPSTGQETGHCNEATEGQWCETTPERSSGEVASLVRETSLLSPTSILSPWTRSLLNRLDYKLLSPCISVKNEDRDLCARLVAREGAEGIWIRLRLKHSMQTLLDGTQCHFLFLLVTKVCKRCSIVQTLLDGTLFTGTKVCKRCT